VIFDVVRLALSVTEAGTVMSNFLLSMSWLSTIILTMMLPLVA
jgi:hypothetical protein